LLLRCHLDCDCDHQNPPSVPMIQLTRFYWCDERLICPTGDVLQIGIANLDACMALRKQWPSVHFFGLEASRRNARKFGATRAALADADRPVTLHLGKKRYEHSTLRQVGNCQRSESVRGMTLTSILDWLQIAKIDLLLSNCEGAEIYLLRQLATDVGQRVRQACVALHCSHVQFYSRQTLDTALCPLTEGWDMDFRTPQGLEYVLLRRIGETP